MKEQNRIPSYYQIGILFPNGKKIIKNKCSLNDLMSTYFINLDSYLNKDSIAEELLNRYKETFSKNNIKIQINFIDSWGHLWKGKVAWPLESKFIEYLNKRINVYNRND